MTQEWFVPAPRTWAPVASPATAVGMLRATVSLIPSWPAPLPPQHCTPVAVIAQVCVPPAVAELTPLESPVTSTGVGESVVVPLPS